mmetsp:Transcript_10189/g.21250  ORF Transcript_10189/g.21250 Transcript_10189/m.21250 type:complete len:370 (+) Transcript_10189:392-1501(+)
MESGLVRLVVGPAEAGEVGDVRVAGYALEGGELVHLPAAGRAAQPAGRGGQLLLLHLHQALELPAARNAVELVHRLYDQLLVRLYHHLRRVASKHGSRLWCCRGRLLRSRHDEGSGGGGERRRLGLAPPAAGVRAPGGVGVLLVLFAAGCGGVDGLGQHCDHGGRGRAERRGRLLLGGSVPLLGLALPGLDGLMQAWLELRSGQDSLESLRHGLLRVDARLVQLVFRLGELLREAAAASTVHVMPNGHFRIRITLLRHVVGEHRGPIGKATLVEGGRAAVVPRREHAHLLDIEDDECVSPPELSHKALWMLAELFVELADQLRGDVVLLHLIRNRLVVVRKELLQQRFLVGQLAAESNDHLPVIEQLGP